MTNTTTEESEKSPLYVGGISGSTTQAAAADSGYCIIVGETSLCNRLYRLLGRPNGAKKATHWDVEVNGPEEVDEHIPAGLDLCDDCEEAGGWERAEEVR